jgi:cobalt/nickel transport system permease protein
MHLPDGYLGPHTWSGCLVVSLGLWKLAARKVRQSVDVKKIPLLAISSAFSFLIMMFNIPIPGGTTGHAVGGVLIALSIGPWAASLAISIALIIQAFLFGDGGITTIGANCLNMAFVMPFFGTWVFNALSKVSPSRSMQAISAGIAGWVGLNAAAFSTAVMLGIQPVLHSGVNGQALYSPYPLSVTIPIMMTEHLLFFGVFEGVVTGMVIYALLGSSSSWILNQKTLKECR